MKSLVVAVAIATAMVIAQNSIFVPINEPDGEVVEVIVTPQHGHIASVMAWQLWGDDDTPTCDVTRQRAVCRITASRFSSIEVWWSPYTPRCGKQPRLTVTDAAGRVLYDEGVPLPAGTTCAYLPGVWTP